MRWAEQWAEQPRLQLSNIASARLLGYLGVQTQYSIVVIVGATQAHGKTVPAKR
jgi:hypothetical protein